MNLTPIQWTTFSANPLKYRAPDGRVVWACEKVSPGCKNCYAEKLSHRYGGSRRAGEWNAATMATLTPFLDEAELHKMLTAKSISGKAVSGSRCFLGDMTDIFGEWVPDELLDRLFDVMWQRSDVTFQVLTKRVDRLIDYISKRAGVRRFGWTDWERSAIEPGACFTIDDIRMRNECGYVGAGDWACDHPTHGGKDQTCDERDCPLASCVDEREKLAAIGVADEHTYGSDGYAEDSQWMAFHTRPPRAACGNVWLGFSAENQTEFDKRMRQFRALRWIVGPHFTLFASLEPLLGPIKFTIDYWPGEDDERAPWDGLSKYDFHHGSENHAKPHLDWVIVGGESGREARPFDLAWARSIVQQCQAAGVAVFCKQMGSNPLGLVLRDSHGGDPQEWPAGDWPREFPHARS